MPTARVQKWEKMDRGQFEVSQAFLGRCLV